MNNETINIKKNRKSIMIFILGIIFLLIIFILCQFDNKDTKILNDNIVSDISDIHVI